MSRQNKLLGYSGFLLTEVLLALGIFSVLLLAFSYLFLIGLSSSHYSGQEIQAQALLSESLEAARIVRQESWDNLINGTFYPHFENGHWSLMATTSAETIGPFTRKIEITDCYRNEQGELVPEPGRLDPSTKKIISSLSWQGAIAKTASATAYLTRYLDNLVWKQTTQAEFDAGEKEYVETTLVNDGEVQLQGGCEDNPAGAWIYDEEFQNTWQIHPSAKDNIKEITQAEGQVYEGERALEISSFSGASTKLRNKGDICTLGFRRLEFYAYNSADIPQSFQIGGHWDQNFVEVSLSPQSWELISLSYADVSGGNEVNFDFIFFKEGNYQNGTKFYLDNVTLDGGIGGYYQLGILTSSVFDAGQSSAFNRIEFDAEIPLNTSVGFQLAVADSPDGPWHFTGPDGTDQENDLYTDPEGEGIRIPGNVGRYTRYKAYLKSEDGKNTPIVYEVRINYSP